MAFSRDSYGNASPLRVSLARRHQPPGPAGGESIRLRRLPHRVPPLPGGSRARWSTTGGSISTTRTTTTTPSPAATQMKSIVCVSSSDLKNWTDHGDVFRVPTNASWADYSWAPSRSRARRNDLSLLRQQRATASASRPARTPTGGFNDAKGEPLVNASTPGASGTTAGFSIPSVFIDDDGQAYLTFGGNGDSNARIIKLNSDMVSVSGSAIAAPPQDSSRPPGCSSGTTSTTSAYSTQSGRRPADRLPVEQQPDVGLHLSGIIGWISLRATTTTITTRTSCSTAPGIMRTTTALSRRRQGYRRRIGGTSALERLDFNADGTIRGHLHDGWRDPARRT